MITALGNQGAPRLNKQAFAHIGRLLQTAVAPAVYLAVLPQTGDQRAVPRSLPSRCGQGRRLSSTLVPQEFRSDAEILLKRNSLLSNESADSEGEGDKAGRTRSE